MNLHILAIVVGVYTLIIGYLGWLGWKQTKNAADFLVGGRETHPVLMALAYGSTFISTAAIIGFGGVAGVFGFSLLWLVALNILVGIFLAFVVFGRRTRRIGAALDAHTFPEFLGRRFQSRFIQGFSGAVIALLMPLYASGVMIGGARFLEVQLKLDFPLALFAFAIVVVAYVFFGGLKGVIYTDAFQGGLMFVGMLVVLIVTYKAVGGLSAHQELTRMASLVPANLAAAGHRGWTVMPEFLSPMWWTLVSTIIMGVGIGVLAQPQLALRFMTVKSGKELNRALVPGGIFILVITGVAYIVGALSNVYFMQHDGKISMAMVMEKVADGTMKPNIDKIMPTFLTSVMPDWFGYLFMLAMLGAAMSTVSGLFHAIGTSIGRDVYQQAIAKGQHQERTVPIAKFGIFVAFVATMILAYNLGMGIIAIATALFFGMCAAVFLPTYVAGLFWPRATRTGAIASMLVGFILWALWVLLVHEKESSVLFVAQALSGKSSIVVGTPWEMLKMVDPFIIALPFSALTMFIVSLCTPRMPDNLLRTYFGSKGTEAKEPASVA